MSSLSVGRVEGASACAQAASVGGDRQCCLAPAGRPPGRSRARKCIRRASVPNPNPHPTPHHTHTLTTTCTHLCAGLLLYPGPHRRQQHRRLLDGGPPPAAGAGAPPQARPACLLQPLAVGDQQPGLRRCRWHCDAAPGGRRQREGGQLCEDSQPGAAQQAGRRPGGEGAGRARYKRHGPGGRPGSAARLAILCTLSRRHQRACPAAAGAAACAAPGQPRRGACRRRRPALSAA